MDEDCVCLGVMWVGCVYVVLCGVVFDLVIYVFECDYF